MKTLTNISTVILAALTMVQFATPAQAAERIRTYNSIGEIADAITLKIPNNDEVLILDLQDLGGSVNHLNRHLSNQLTVALSNTSRVKVVDRQLIETLIAERKLAEAGLINDNGAIVIGKMVGAKSVIYGTAFEIGKKVTLNMKIADIENGVILGGLNCELKKDKSLKSLAATSFKIHETKKVSELELRVSEIRMEQAIKERIRTAELKKNPTQTVRAAGIDRNDASAEPTIWDKLQYSGDLE